MIYKDAKASNDGIYYPADRGNEPCINCGNLWGNHHGWGCTRVHMGKNFVNVPEGYRFLTQPMGDSLINPIIQDRMDKALEALEVLDAKVKRIAFPMNKAESKEITEWRISRNDQPGECACGIVRSMCDYHK